MKKDAIKVGNTTMFAIQIPVNIVFDEMYYSELEDEEEELIAERFRVLEIDGSYLVIIDSEETNYIAFCSEEDAFAYLDMYGVGADKEENVDTIYE